MTTRVRVELSAFGRLLDRFRGPPPVKGHVGEHAPPADRAAPIVDVPLVSLVHGLSAPFVGGHTRWVRSSHTKAPGVPRWTLGISALCPSGSGGANRVGMRVLVLPAEKIVVVDGEHRVALLDCADPSSPHGSRGAAGRGAQRAPERPGPLDPVDRDLHAAWVPASARAQTHARATKATAPSSKEGVRG